MAYNPEIDKGVLLHEYNYALRAFLIADSNHKQAKLAFGEAVANSGGDWVFDDSASQVAMQEAGMKGARAKDLKNIVESEIVPYPSADDAEVQPGSRVAVQFGTDENAEIYDIQTRRINDIPKDEAVDAIISADSPIGQALLGSKLNEIVTWTTPNKVELSVRVCGLDQIAQLQFYGKIGLLHSVEQ